MAVTLLLSACASAPIDQVDLMPAPQVFGDGLIQLFDLGAEAGVLGELDSDDRCSDDGCCGGEV